MTGTSRALKRLGVAGLSAVVMTVGLGTMATTASAATVNSQATGVTLTPPSDTATVGTCNPFTAAVTPAPGAGNNYTVTVTISQPANDATQTPAVTTIGFCDVDTFVPSAGTNAQPAPADAAEGSGAGSGVFASGPTNNAGAPTCSGQSATKASPGVLTCTAVYTTDENGKVTFGVTSNTAGTMNVNAGVDVNQNGGIDTFEPQDNSTKTWVANTPATGNGALDCKPTTATNAAGAGQTHKITCTVTTAQGTGVTDQDVNMIIQSGPDAGNTVYTCPEDKSPTTGSAAGQYGKYVCTITNNGVTGTDKALIFVDENSNNVVDSGEPQQTVSKTWVAPAPSGATVTLTCSPNQTNTAGTACQDDPTQDGSADFTATVTNNNTSPASPAGNVIVNFNLTETSPAADVDKDDTESLSATSCTTDANGQCTVTFTDTSPTDGESFRVDASVPLQTGGPATASATKTFHTPAKTEARNIDVTPESGEQQSGGSQTFKAAVTDRFGNPVNGVDVTFSETGPGGFRGSNVCTTDATGTCTVDVTSLPSEEGTETVTGSLASGSTECEDVAGTVNGTANQTPAPAGNCTDSGSVTWTQQAAVSRERPHIDIPNDGAVRLGAHKITIAGTAAAGHVVQLFKNGNAKEKVNAGSDGRFSFRHFINRRTNFYVRDLTNGLASHTVTVYDKIKVALKCHSPRDGKLVCHLNSSPNQPKTAVDYTYSNNRDGSKGSKAGETSRHGNDKLVVKGLTRGHYQVSALVHGGHHRRHGVGADELHVG